MGSSYVSVTLVGGNFFRYFLLFQTLLTSSNTNEEVSSGSENLMHCHKICESFKMILDSCSFLLHSDQ